MVCYSQAQPIVSIDWLASHLNEPKLIVLDCTIARVGQTPLMPSVDDAAIQGAKFFDLKNAFSSTASISPSTQSSAFSSLEPLGVSVYPNMCPSPEQFQEQVRKLGINNNSILIVYDRHGIYSAARAWYLFKSFGFQNVAVLNGGLPAWIAAGQVTSNLTIESNTTGNYEVGVGRQTFLTAEAVHLALHESAKTVLDARSEERFNGSRPEPRPKVRSGHIPNSQSLHYARLLNSGFLRSDTELEEIFSTYDTKELIFSCGSGVTACILALAAEKIGLVSYSVYDGSWAEWGSRMDLPCVNPSAVKNAGQQVTNQGVDENI